jgi:hypothetical protein
MPTAQRRERTSKISRAFNDQWLWFVMSHDEREDDYEFGSFGDLTSEARIGGKTSSTTRWPEYAVPLVIAGLFVTFSVYVANDVRIPPPPETGTRDLCLAAIRLVVEIKEAQRAGIPMDDEIAQVAADHSAESNAQENAQHLVTKIYADRISPGEEKDVHLADCNDRFPVIP